MKITKNEMKAMRGIWDSSYHDSLDRTDSYVWSWSANPFPNKRSFGGAIASLVRKGLVKQSGEGEDACVALTKAGVDAIAE